MNDESMTFSSLGFCVYACSKRVFYVTNRSTKIINNNNCKMLVKPINLDTYIGKKLFDSKMFVMGYIWEKETKKISAFWKLKLALYRWSHSNKA